MQTLTVQQAADNYIYPSNRFHSENVFNAFKAGAEWQKEQTVKIFKTKLEGITDQSSRAIMRAIIDELT